MRIKLALVLAACITTLGLVGCSGDDNNTNDGGPDASKDAPTGDVIQKNDGGGDGGTCNFAAFVIDLIDNHTTMTDKPSVDLGQNCVDNHDQTEFKPLFP